MVDLAYVLHEVLSTGTPIAYRGATLSSGDAVTKLFTTLPAIERASLDVVFTLKYGKSLANFIQEKVSSTSTAKDNNHALLYGQEAEGFLRAAVTTVLPYAQMAAGLIVGITKGVVRPTAELYTLVYQLTTSPRQTVQARSRRYARVVADDEEQGICRGRSPPVSRDCGNLQDRRPRSQEPDFLCRGRGVGQALVEIGTTFFGAKALVGGVTKLPTLTRLIITQVKDKMNGVVRAAKTAIPALAQAGVKGISAGLLKGLGNAATAPARALVTRVTAPFKAVQRRLGNAPGRGAFARQVAVDPAAHARDFATRNADALERLIEQRMRDVGVSHNLIGDMPLGGGPRRAFHPQIGDGGGVTVGRGINVDNGVFNPHLLGDPAAGGVARTWARARLRDRIDAVIAHEFEEAIAGTHGAALQNAPNTGLNISREARQILREMAGSIP